MTPAKRTLLLALADTLLVTDGWMGRRDALEAATAALDAEGDQDSGQVPKPASDALSRFSASTACQHADYWQTDRYRKCRDCGAMSYFIPAWGPWH